MNYLIRTIVAAFVVGACCVSLVSAQAQSSVRVPAAQRALTSLLVKYNDLDKGTPSEGPPNEMQSKKIESDFRKHFCAMIPTDSVSGWIGKVNTIDDNSPDKGIRLALEVHTNSLSNDIINRNGGTSLGIQLTLGNYYSYGVSAQNTQRHSVTTIPVGSPLYNISSTLRTDDIIMFSGSFVPFSSARACTENLGHSTYFSLFRFSAIRKLGHDLTLE